jgi:putative oxidoreductase
MCMKKLCITNAGWTISLLRLFLAWIFIKVGLGKAFGLFGGPGIEGFTGYLTNLEFPFPVIFAYLVAWLELIAGIMFLLGLGTRLASLPILVIMIVAIVKVHPTDFNYPALALIGSLILMEMGSGKLSVDGLLAKKE